MLFFTIFNTVMLCVDLFCNGVPYDHYDYRQKLCLLLWQMFLPYDHCDCRQMLHLLLWQMFLPYDHCDCRQMLCLLLWQMFLPILIMVLVIDTTSVYNNNGHKVHHYKTTNTQHHSVENCEE